MINSYSFGEIVIDGKRYTNDVILCQEIVYPHWWRKSGHALCQEDLNTVFNFNPTILIIGTGHMGVMQVSAACRAELEKQGIIVHIEKTRRACTLFNKLLPQKKVAAALHLTC